MMGRILIRLIWRIYLAVLQGEVTRDEGLFTLVWQFMLSGYHMQDLETQCPVG